MLKILAVAKHVFRESLRKKILFVLGLFFLILLVSSFFLEAVSPEDRVKLVMRVSFGSLAFFGVMAAIFLAATSLPGEVEEKLIQVVMTKPIGRFQFLLGKILGFISVLALLLFIMGVLSWALIQIVAEGRTLPAERLFSPRSLTFSGEDAERIKLLEEAAKAGRVSWWAVPEEILAIWHWEGLRGALPWGEATFRVRNITPEGGPRRTEVELRAYSPLGVVRVQEIVVEDGEPAAFEFEPGEAEGEFRVEVRGLDPDFAIGVERKSLKILAPPGNFHLNFIKCLLLLFFKLTLMVVITVMGSTFLSSAVTITFSLFVYLTGHMIEFLKGVLATIVAAGVLVAPHCPTCPVGEPPAHPWLMGAFEFFLHWFTELFPNLRRFGGSRFLVEGVDIPLPLLVNSLLYMSIYAALALTIAYLFFRRKEFR